MKRGPFGLSLPWSDLALGGFRIVSKKWTDQCEDCSLKKTSRERPKLAPYLRLKNSKRISKYSLLRYRKNPKVEPNWHTRGDTLKFFIHSVANHQKNWRGTFGEKKF